MVYKLATPFSVGTLANPVVAGTVGIAVFHIATLVSLWWGGALGEKAGGGPTE